MVTIRDAVTGRLLGYAMDDDGARSMAHANGWRNCVVEEYSSPRALQIEPYNPGADPRNMRGSKM